MNIDDAYEGWPQTKEDIRWKALWTAIDEATDANRDSRIKDAISSLPAARRPAPQAWLDDYKGPDPRFRAVGHLNLRSTPWDVATKVLTDPHLEGVRAFTAGLGQAGRVLDALEGSTVATLELLDLECVAAAKEVRRLGNEPLYADVRYLSLAGSKIGTNGIILLTDAPNYQHLRMLDVGNLDGVSTKALTGFLKAERWNELRGLRVSMDERPPSANFPMMFCADGNFPNLTHLSFGRLPMRDKQLQTLAQHSVAAQLRHFETRGGGIFSEEALVVLFQSLQNVESLVIQNGSVAFLTAEAAKAMVEGIRCTTTVLA